MRRTAIILALGLTLLSGAVAVAKPPHHSGRTITSTNRPDGRCHEDMRCWRWSTMGGLERGVYLAHHRARVVVEPCGFAFADYSGAIDWTRTKPLRGDAYARAHGCDPALYAPNARKAG